jgi:hypothetical protein
MSPALPDWVRFIVVPILIGFISTLVGVIFKRLDAYNERMRTMRDQQMGKAGEICTKVIDTLDSVYAHIKYHAWYVAWRKALPPTADYVGSDLQMTDEQQWKDFNVALATLREHAFEYETELKGSFGQNGIEPKLYLEIDAVVNDIADKLSMIYYSNDAGDSTMWLGQGIPKEGFTEKDRLKSREEFVLCFAYISFRIKLLSSVMIACIQRGNIGTLPKTGPEPSLSPEMERMLKETEIHNKTGAPEQA